MAFTDEQKQKIQAHLQKTVPTFTCSLCGGHQCALEDGAIALPVVAYTGPDQAVTVNRSLVCVAIRCTHCNAEHLVSIKSIL